jgi:hypothetical protein
VRPISAKRRNKYGEIHRPNWAKVWTLNSNQTRSKKADSEKRGEGIIEWVGTHEVDSFIIRDDEWFDFKELGLQSRVIKTEFYDENGGLTDDHVEIAIELLNSEIPN